MTSNIADGEYYSGTFCSKNNRKRSGKEAILTGMEQTCILKIFQYH